MGQMRRDPDTYWRNAGHQVGRERAAIDRLANKRQALDQLWIPENVTPAWVEGLKAGYLEGMTPDDPSYPKTTEF